MTETTKLTDTIHIPEQPTPSSLRCRHVVDGRRCGSPAMRGERFCYHHHETRRPVAALRQRRARQSTFSVPAPESRPQIQQAIGDIMARLGNNDIDPRRAGLLLYALQLATSNLNEHQRQNARAPQQNHTVEPSHIPATQQDSSPLPSDPRQHPHSSPLAETPAPAEEPHHPEQSTPIAPTLLPEEKCRPEPSTQIASTLPPEVECHPERSAAESKDLRSTTPDPAPQTAEHIHYGSGPTPDLENPQTQRAHSIDFTPPPPVWHRLSRPVGRMLLETLGRYHAGELPDEHP